MKPEEAGNKIEKIIRDSSNKFAADVVTSQRGAYNGIVVLLKELEVDNNGNLKRTAKNVRRVRTINRQINGAIITDAYRNRVKAYLGGFSQIEAVNNTYYGLNFPEFKSDLALFKLMKEESINSATTLLLEGGIDANFTEPIKNILTQNVMSGASYTDMIDQLDQYILGNSEVDGRLLAYTRQITNDSLHIYSGLYNEAVTEELGLEYVRYTGSSKDTTRDFCRARAGKYYSRKEVEGWADNSWAGKYRGTTSSNIFQYVGGYNCRHILVPVSEAVVPQSVIKRNN